MNRPGRSPLQGTSNSSARIIPASVVAAGEQPRLPAGGNRPPVEEAAVGAAGRQPEESVHAREPEAGAAGTPAPVGDDEVDDQPVAAGSEGTEPTRQSVAETGLVEAVEEECGDEQVEPTGLEAVAQRVGADPGHAAAGIPGGRFHPVLLLPEHPGAQVDAHDLGRGLHAPQRREQPAVAVAEHEHPAGGRQLAEQAGPGVLQPPAEDRPLQPAVGPGEAVVATGRAAAGAGAVAHAPAR